MLPRLSLWQLFVMFGRYGCVAWGGPVAQIEIMRTDIVERERWLSRDEFNRILAVYQALPGPEATELAVYFGMRAHGHIGGIVSGLGFILPGTVLMLLLSVLYVHVGLHPAAAAFFIGCQAAVIALMARSLLRLGRACMNGHDLWVTFFAALALQIFGMHFAVVLLCSGIAYVVGKRLGTWALYAGIAACISMALVVSNGEFGLQNALQGERAPALLSETPTNTHLFWSGLKAGTLTFGGAYTVLPFLMDDTVGQGWIRLPVFLDGVALSGVIPAPFVIFATFIGYIIKGIPGALLMTLGIFLPAFAITLFGHTFLESLIGYQPLRHLLEGITAGVMGLFAITVFSLGMQRLTDGQSITIAIVAFVIMMHWRSKMVIPLCILLAGAFKLLLVSAL